jgi:hypothetical protein
MERIEKITNIIAQDTWEYLDSKGKKTTSKIFIGKPRGGKKDWYCPVSIEHFTPHIVPACGLGPVDSLMNAMTLVKSFFDLKKINLLKTKGSD